MARPGSYNIELNRILKENGLPPVKAPPDVPSGDLFGARMAEGVRAAVSQESIRSGVSGFQEESYKEMMGVQEERDPRRQQEKVEGAIYSLTKGMSLEDLVGGRRS